MRALAWVLLLAACASHPRSADPDPSPPAPAPAPRVAPPPAPALPDPVSDPWHELFVALVDPMQLDGKHVTIEGVIRPGRTTFRREDGSFLISSEGGGCIRKCEGSQCCDACADPASVVSGGGSIEIVGGGCRSNPPSCETTCTPVAYDRKVRATGTLRIRAAGGGGHRVEIEVDAFDPPP